jgi:hypothetical protein
LPELAVPAHNRGAMNPIRALAVVVITSCFGHAIIAAEPTNVIVEVKNGYVIGAVQYGKWLDSGKAAATIKPGASFRVYGLTGEIGASAASKPESVDQPCPDTQMVKLSPPREEGALAVTAAWNALPRKPKTADPTQAVYVQAVREFLQTQRLANPEIKITQILRVDLDGDGEEEVLIAGTNYLAKDDRVPSSAPAGSYSFVFLRRVVSGKVQTQLVTGEFYPQAKNFNAPNQYRVLAVLDLDGDGKMEVIVDSAYYEGGGTTIYRCAPGKVDELLETGCGA